MAEDYIVMKLFGRTKLLNKMDGGGWRSKFINRPFETQISLPLNLVYYKLFEVKIVLIKFSLIYVKLIGNPARLGTRTRLDSSID